MPRLEPRAPYYKTALTYVLGGKEYKKTCWHGYAFSNQLATITIFRRHFGANYNKARCDAEDRLDADGTVRFNNTLIHTVEWETSGPYHLTMAQFLKRIRNK